MEIWKISRHAGDVPDPLIAPLSHKKQQHIVNHTEDQQKVSNSFVNELEVGACH